MGWETRRRKRYYYRKVRDPQTGRVRSIYFGSSGLAIIAAQEDSQKKEERKRQRMLKSYMKSRQYKETLAKLVNKRKL